jgi:tyrosyl-tRNA synthetase
MGKSLGNDIGVGLPANDLFGKIMSIPDEPLRQYFTLLTDVPLAEVDRLLGLGVNPRDAKERLARTIIAGLISPEAAEAAAAEFRGRARGEDPSEIPEVAIGRDQLDAEGRMPAPRLIVSLGLEASTSNARRAIEQGGVRIGADRTPVTDPRTAIAVDEGLIVRVGKLKIARVKLQ